MIRRKLNIEYNRLIHYKGNTISEKIAINNFNIILFSFITYYIFCFFKYYFFKTAL